MADEEEEKVKGENEGVELDKQVLEDVSGGESTEGNNNIICNGPEQ